MSPVPLPPTQNRLQKSINDFRSARNRAALESIASRLTGRSSALLSYDDVVQKLKIVNQAGRGVREIPIAAIVGSVGRYTDFSRSFLPKSESDEERWARVASVPDFYALPPIDVYQIGDVYFVLDGNHRVSIARQRGIDFIPAEVTEVQTRAPIPPNISPDALILQAEYRAFLEQTNLDELRPGANLRVSVPGQYSKLENHMEVHRFFIEMKDDVELSDEEAVVRWHDEAYLPVVKAAREQGILRDFPNRTETDLYIWISEHQAQLRNELGWQVRPEVATADLADRLEKTNTNLGKRVGRTIINIAAPKGGLASQSWSQSKVAARYSDRLFTDLLVVLQNIPDNQPVLDQALIIAQQDDSHIFGLAPFTESEGGGPVSNSALDFAPVSAPKMKRWFEAQCQAAGVEGRLAVQGGEPVETICERAVLADLILYGRPSTQDNPEQLLTLIRQAPRPVFLAPAAPSPINKVLLAYDGGAKSREALFVATYMAERWGSSLTVLLAPEGRIDEDSALNHARNYLDMHEVDADYVVCEQDPIGLLVTTAEDCQADLIIAGGYSHRRFGRRGPGDIVSRLVTEWPGALLICT